MAEGSQNDFECIKRSWDIIVCHLYTSASNGVSVCEIFVGSIRAKIAYPVAGSSNQQPTALFIKIATSSEISA